MLDTVAVPEQFEPIFRKAQEYVSTYFSQKKEDASTGTIEVFGQRYILIRAASMSVDFFDTIKGMFKDWGEENASEMARSLLFDVAHTIGKMDARNFHQRMGLRDPIEKLSAGPIHFSYTGWAFVDILAESKPTTDENFYLIYNHPFSFEADAWEKSGKKSSSCVCTMSAGYSSGWCEESFGIPLVASEIMCKAKGDSACRFIMAHPSKITQYLQAYLHSHPEIPDNATLYRTGGFFQEFKQAQDSLRKSEERFRTVFENTVVGLYRTTPDGRILLANPALVKMMGYQSFEELAQLNLEKEGIDPSTPRSVFKERIEKEGSVVGLESVWIRRDGTKLFVFESASAARDGNSNILYYEGTAEDITERKRAERALERLNKDFETTIEELIRSNLQLQEFVHIAAHDLKTPLRGIGILADWLATDYADKFDQQGQDQLKLLVTRVKRIDKLIDGMLQYSRIKRDRKNEQNINLASLLAEIVSEIKPPQNIKIDIQDHLPEVVCEKTHIKQVFRNLLTNAVTYMDKPQGLITVACADEGEFWRFSVCDNGPGIEQKYFDRIFRIFQMLAPRDDLESAGIGLTAAKKIVELYIGGIWVESTPGQGSTFFFTWPKQRKDVQYANLAAHTAY
jgi:PAS domain S-box-containing protein